MSYKNNRFVVTESCGDCKVCNLNCLLIFWGIFFFDDFFCLPVSVFVLVLYVWLKCDSSVKRISCFFKLIFKRNFFYYARIFLNVFWSKCFCERLFCNFFASFSSYRWNRILRAAENVLVFKNKFRFVFGFKNVKSPVFKIYITSCRRNFYVKGNSLFSCLL